MQSARPLKKYHWAFKSGFGFQSIKNIQTEDKDLDHALEGLQIPFLELGLRYGLSEKIELGVKYNTPFTGTMNSRYNLMNDDRFAVSTGLDFGYGQFSLKPNTESQTWKIYETKIGLFSTYEFSRTMGVHGSLGFLNRFNRVEAHDQYADSQVEVHRYLSTTVGCNYKFIFLETGIVKSISSPEFFYSLAMGIVYPLDNVIRPDEENDNLNEDK